MKESHCDERYLRLACWVGLALLHWELSPLAHAHGQLHVRACAGETTSSNCQNGYKNHTGCNQWVDRQVSYVSQWEGSAHAYGHASIHPNCAWHYKYQLWATSGPFGGSAASIHINHAVHFSLTGLDDHTHDPGEDEGPEPEPVLPPEGSEREGAFSMLEVEVVQLSKTVRFNFAVEPGARLQVDGRGLKPGDESVARLDFKAGDALGRLELRVRDGGVTLVQEGVFERAELKVEPHPAIPGLYLLALGSNLNFEWPGVVDETDVEINGEAWQSVARPDCVPVTIVSHPQSVTNNACGSDCATFSVQAAGSDPKTYQWIFNGTPIAGAVGSTHTVCPVTAADEGLYSVVVSNACGRVLSREALLTVMADRTPPQLFCPDRIIQPCRTRAGTVVHFNVYAADGCGSNVTVTCVPASGSVFPPGTSQVVCTAVNTAGLSAECRFPVIVYGDCADDSCLELRCPEDITVPCEGPGGTVVTYAVQAANACGPDDELTVICDPPSGSAFPAGLTVVTCRAMDAAGRETRCSFNVEVVDTDLPVVSCPSNIVVRAQAPDGAIVSWAASATDECDREPVIVCRPPSGSLFPVGTTEVTCIARDASGNTGLCGFTVTVRPPLPLEISRQADGGLLLRWHGAGVPQESGELDGSSGWRDLTQRVVPNGEERFVLVPSSHARRFFRIASHPLAPLPDDDKDGVPDAKDRCPNTPAGVAVDACGCAAVQIAARPGVVLEPVQQELGALRGELGMRQELQPIQELLALVDEGLSAAQAYIGVGELIEGVAAHEQTEMQLEEAYRMLASHLQLAESGAAGQPVPGTQGYGDTTDADVRTAVLRMMVRQLEGLINQARTAGESLDLMLAEGGRETIVKGAIVSVDDAARLVTLDNGMVIGLAEDHFDESLFEGNDVTIRMTNLGPNSGLARDISSSAGLQFPSDLFPVSHLQVRIAPVQRMAPNYPPPYLLHHPNGYLKDGMLWLEQGMRLAVQMSSNGSGGDAVPSLGFTSYSMQLVLSYKSKNNQNKTVTLAHDLKAGQTPVELPGDMSQVPAVLTATLRKRLCQFTGLNTTSCSAPETVSSTTYTLKVRPRFSYAQALYNRTVVDLEDSPLDTSFRPVWVEGLFKQSALTSVPGVWFEAEGYSVISASQSSKPYVNPIYQGTPFAIYNADFYSDDYLFDPVYSVGVTNAAGLRWPRANGYRNGKAFSYAVGLPWIVRDLVNECQTSFNGYSYEDCFYRLPFKGGFPTWIMGQGNFGGFTHTGSAAFAYDFIAPQGTKILAARGGVVADVLESSSGNCFNSILNQCVNCGGTPNNYVVIRHQDNTFGWYFHMPMNGVWVSKGQKVRRGDTLGVVGNTGCSSTAHVHFEARGSLFGPSIAINFEPCFSPGPGDFLFSTNKGWNE